MRKRNSLQKLLQIGLTILMFCTSCTLNKDNFRSVDIRGDWVLNDNQINYPLISFGDDSSAVFRSKGDTVYRFKYSIEGQFLFLKDINQQEFKDKILVLTKDSLVFETLAENKGVQRYSKK